MLRTIKIRAWDYIWEKMFTSEQITAIDFENNCIEYKDWFKYNDEEYYVNDQKSLDDLWLMQSTGKFDKNKKEIFESDIAIVKSAENNEVEHLCVGEWDKRNLQWQLKAHKKIKGEYIGNLVAQMGAGAFKQCEVVGNIYQNKELLQ